MAGCKELEYVNVSRIESLSNHAVVSILELRCIREIDLSFCQALTTHVFLTLTLTLNLTLTLDLNNLLSGVNNPSPSNHHEFSETQMRRTFHYCDTPRCTLRSTIQPRLLRLNPNDANPNHQSNPRWMFQTGTLCFRYMVASKDHTAQEGCTVEGTSPNVNHIPTDNPNIILIARSRRS